MADYQEQVDSQTQLTFLAGPGVYVVPMDQQQMNRERFHQAVDLLQRLKTHPLDVGALALPDGVLPPAEMVTELANIGIVFPKLHAESAYARAVEYIRQFLSQRAQGLAHLKNFQEVQANRSPARRPRLQRLR